MRVDVLDYDRAADRIARRALQGEGGYVCVANVHMTMEAWDDPAFRAVVNGADLVTSDGVPLVWGLRALGATDARRVYGPDLMLHLCRRAAKAGIAVGLLGGTEEVLEALTDRLRQEFPGLQVSFVHSPPFGSSPAYDEEAVLNELDDSGVGILFVGLGCPKQEVWMSERVDRVGAVMVGVGAAFDFLSGAKRQSPKFLQRIGLEWLFRLVNEPRRLARRYLIHNPRFTVLFLVQLLRTRMA